MKKSLSLGLRHIQRISLCVVLLLLATRVAAAASADIAGAPVPSYGSGLSFAFADFDGDHHPDFAGVQTNAPGASRSGDYWVGLRLSASGSRYIRVVGPSGGLLVEARDVNGDHAVDLVFATAWSGKPLAILLNDGHGNFSRAEPSQFPEASRQSNGSLANFIRNFRDTAATTQEFRSDLSTPSNDLASLRVASEPARPARPVFHLDRFLISRASRAPPRLL